MSGVKGVGPSSVPPTIGEEITADQKGDAKATGDVEETQAEQEVSEGSKEAAAAKKSEAAIAEKSKAAELHEEIETQGVPLQAADPKTVLKEGSKGQEVKELQHQLNIWRKENGLPPIKEDGKYGDDTKKAVLAFQESTHHTNNDGKAGPMTRDALALENDPNFKEVSPYMQGEVKGLLASWKDNPAARTNLMQIVTDENFKKLDTEQQQAVLSRLSQNPETKNIGDLKDAMKEFAGIKEDPNFKSLNPEVQDTFTRAFFAVGPKTPEARKDLATIMKDKEFAKLSPEVQQKVGEAFFANPGSAEYTKKMSELVGSEGFSGLSKEQQTKILDSITNNPDPKFVSELAKLAKEGKLAGLDDAAIKKLQGTSAPEVAEKKESEEKGPLSGLSSYTRGQIQGLYDSWKDNPTAQKNLMKIASDENFKKLDEEEQQAVLAKLMQNPGGAKVDSLISAMKDFAAVKDDPNFKSIDPEIRDRFTRAFFGLHPDDKAARADMLTMLKDKNFAKLPPEVQATVGRAFTSNADDPEYTKRLTELVTSGAFAELSKEDQSRFMETIAENPSVPLATELARLARLGVLDDLGAEGLSKLLADFGLSKT